MTYSALDEKTAEAAGIGWRLAKTKGQRRDRVVADFLIAAHARLQADQLLTRDRGFYRACFSDLKIVTPCG